MKYRFATYVKGEVSPDYGEWLRNERIQKIMDQKDAAGIPLLTNPEAYHATDSQNRKVYILEFDTTKEKFDEYAKRVVEMKAHTAATYPNAFDASGPFRFDKEFSIPALNDGKEFGRLLRDAVTGEALAFRRLALEENTEHRVRLDIERANKLTRQQWVGK